MWNPILSLAAKLIPPAAAADLLSGFNFDFPLEYAVLALAMYGATGVAAGEIAAYTYWCVEKSKGPGVEANGSGVGVKYRSKTSRFCRNVAFYSINSRNVDGLTYGCGLPKVTEKQETET